MLILHPHPLWGYTHKVGNLVLSQFKSKQTYKRSVAKCLMHNALDAYTPLTHQHCSDPLLGRSIYSDGLLSILLPRWTHCLQQVYLTPWEQKEAQRIQNRCWIDPGSHLPNRSVLFPVNPYTLISLTYFLAPANTQMLVRGRKISEDLFLHRTIASRSFYLKLRFARWGAGHPVALSQGNGELSNCRDQPEVFFSNNEELLQGMMRTRCLTKPKP